MEITEDFRKRRKEFVMGKKLLIGMSFLLNLIVFGVLGVIVVGNTLQPEMVPLFDHPEARPVLGARV